MHKISEVLKNKNSDLDLEISSNIEYLVGEKLYISISCLIFL